MRHLILRSLSFLILLTVLSQANCRDYTARKLYELAINADKIVYGTIHKVFQDKITLKIDGSITGEKDSITYNIPEYGRENYEIGQEIIVFLEFWGRDLEVMTYVNEGEMPIANDSVFINISTLPHEALRIRPITSTIEQIQSNIHHYQVWNSNFCGMKMNFEQFIDVVEQVRTCFMFEYGTYKEPIAQRQIICSKENLDISNLLINWIVEVWEGKHER